MGFSIHHQYQASNPQTFSRLKLDRYYLLHVRFPLNRMDFHHTLPFFKQPEEGEEEEDRSLLALKHLLFE